VGRAYSVSVARKMTPVFLGALLLVLVIVPLAPVAHATTTTTVTTVSCNIASIAVNSETDCTVTLTAFPSLVTPVTGETVTLFVISGPGSATFGTCTLNSGGTCSAYALGTVAGSATVKASYPGDPNNGATTNANEYSFSLTVTTPYLSLSPSSGAAGATITATGSGYSFSSLYNICYEASTRSATPCPSTTQFSSDSSGNIPSAVTVTSSGTSTGLVVVSDNGTGSVVASAAFYFVSTNCGSGGDLVQSACEDFSTGTSQSLTFASPVTSGNVLVVLVSNNDYFASVSSVSDSFGSSFTQAETPECSSFASGCVMIYYATLRSGGTDTVSVYVSDPFNDIYVLEVSGVTTVRAVGVGASGSTTGTTAMGTSSTSFTGPGFLVSVGETNSQDSFTPGTGFTLMAPPPGNLYSVAEFSSGAVSSPTTFPLTISSGADTWTYMGVEFNQPSAVPDLPLGVLPLLLIIPLLYYYISRGRLGASRSGRGSLRIRLAGADRRMQTRPSC
jgi:hypothetical protein